MKYVTIIAVILTLAFITSCGEEQPKNIMGEPVDFTINLNAWDKELRSPYAIKTFTTPRAEGLQIGLGGLLVISNGNDIIGPNIYGLLAYDLACPYEKNKNVLLSVEDIENKTMAVCKKCGSTFNIIDFGIKENGPSETGLQRYNAWHNNQRPGVFRITR